MVSRALCRIDRVLSQSWRFYYTFLETSCKIKWNIKPPFPQYPPKSRMKPREGQIKKTCHFPILDLGGRGGLGFPFILSKIKWNSKPPSPPNEEWRRVKGKNSLFPHPGSGEWGVKVCPRVQAFRAAETWILGDKTGRFTWRTLLPFAIDLRL